MKLIIASNNKGKIREYKDIFEPLGFLVVSQGEENINLEVEETGTTFEKNASLKAQAIYDLSHCCVISDDSGLEVEALGGEPGLYSARYKGLETEHERRIAVLKGLEGKENRNARFVTCICFIDETGKEHLFTGIWNGVIAEKEEGTNGFGYDPIPEVIIHLGLHHLLDGAAEQVFESILDVFGGFDVVFLQELLDDLTFSFGHHDFMDGFLFSSCHNKGLL